jgi:hypothetical protein
LSFSQQFENDTEASNAENIGHNPTFMSDKIKLQLLITCGCWFIYTPA